MRVAAIQGRHDGAPHDEISDEADPILSLEDEALVDAFVHRFASFRLDPKQKSSLYILCSSTHLVIILMTLRQAICFESLKLCLYLLQY